MLTAKHIADIIRTVQVGAARRVSKRLEDELEERRVAENAERFLDVAEDAFPDLKAVEEGQKSPSELRGESLLGSATMLRVLAGAYHELVIADKELADRMTDGEVTKFFAKLAPHMTAPVSEDGAWRATGVFMDSGMAPQASQGDVRKLVTTIIEWSGDTPEWLG